MKEFVEKIAEMLGGKVVDMTVTPNGDGFALVSMPLPSNHWIFGDPSAENRNGDFVFEPPPMPLRMGTNNPLRNKMIKAIVAAGRYAVRASTMHGKEMDFDPDALVQNIVVGMLGYHTEDGLSDDDWANPKKLSAERGKDDDAKPGKV